MARTGGKTSYLMGFVSRQENAVYFQIRSRHRAEEVAEVITAACECVLGTDRFRSYDAERFSQMDMQKCMSHIVKNLSEVRVYSRICGCFLARSIVKTT